MKAPAFFFGFQRSGTTLLSAMMDSHPQLAVPFSVTGMWYRYGARLAAYDGLRTPAGLERLVGDVCREERIAFWRANIVPADVLAGLPLGDYSAVVRRLHELYARGYDKPYWGHGDISTLTEMRVASAWFPNASFVHLVRDARDVALSNRDVRWGVGNIRETAEAWQRPTL